MKKEKIRLLHSTMFLILIIFALIFFSYTNGIVFVTNDGEIVNSVYPTISLVINTIIIIATIAIIDISIISIKKIPKDKDDYSKALVISNIIFGSVLNAFIVFWPIANYLIKCI